MKKPSQSGIWQIKQGLLWNVLLSSNKELGGERETSLSIHVF